LTPWPGGLLSTAIERPLWLGPKRGTQLDEKDIGCKVPRTHLLEISSQLFIDLDVEKGKLHFGVL